MLDKVKNIPLFNREFTRFIIVGVMNTIHYYLIYLLILYVFQLNYLYAHFIGFLFSLIGSFFLNSYFTYRVKPTLAKFFQFPLTQVVQTIATAVFLYVSVEWLHIHDVYAPLIVVFFTVPITFFITGSILKR